MGKGERKGMVSVLQLAIAPDDTENIRILKLERHRLYYIGRIGGYIKRPASSM